MSIYRAAVNKPVTTALIFVAFAIFGIFSLMKTSIALLPDFDANIIMVMSTYPGASAADVETNLTKTLENGLNGVSNLKNLTSQSKENLSLLTLEFQYGTNIDEAMNDVRDKLDMINSSLPDNATTPVIFKFSADDMPIMILSATAEESLPGLDKILDDKLTTPLARVNGVGTISVSGAPTREIHVYCDPNKLQAYGLSVAGISSTIAAENRNVPSGSIDIGSETYSLRVQKEFSDPSELLDVVVGFRGGNAIYLRDVATIKDEGAEKEQIAYTGETRSAQIVIQKQTGANTVNVIKAVKKQLAQIEQTLPSDIQIKTVIDSSDSIINSINSLKETILITFLVVMLVVYVFLGRWRATFIIILSIPISLLASLVYLYATGNTLNIISMSALVHCDRNGGGRLHCGVGKYFDALGEGREPEGSLSSRNRRGGIVHCGIHSHNVLRVPAFDIGVRYGRNHVPPARLDCFHHYVRVTCRRIDLGANALLEDVKEQAEKWQVA
jgi:HAE1 family hydrophobic/amphiphilic exporter-1